MSEQTPIRQTIYFQTISRAFGLVRLEALTRVLEQPDHLWVAGSYAEGERRCLMGVLCNYMTDTQARNLREGYDYQDRCQDLYTEDYVVGTLGVILGQEFGQEYNFLGSSFDKLVLDYGIAEAVQVVKAVAREVFDQRTSMCW